MNRSRLGSAVVILVVSAVSGLVYAQGASQSDVRKFITEMAIANMADVELGKLAAERTMNPNVRAFGQMMVRDHSKASDELEQVADQLGVPLPAQPDRKHQDLAVRLSKLSGAEFDREYMNAMVQGHEEMMNRLRQFAVRSEVVGTTGGERSLSRWATNMLPVASQHLEQARELQKKVAR